MTGCTLTGRGRAAALAARVLIAAACGVLPALVATGCVVISSGCSYISTIEGQRTSQIPHVAQTPIDVTTENGSITIEATAGSNVSITAKIRAQTQERLDGVKVLAERRADNSLAVYVVWPGGERKSNEGCSLSIQVPDSNSVKARTSNGAITLKGLEGPADVKTSNGAIMVKSQTGDVDAHTSNGSITVEQATGKVAAQTSNGRIGVSLTDAAEGPVNLKSSNGGVTLGVGRGFAGTLTAHTSNGKVRIRSGTKTTEVSSTNDATQTFGQGGVGGGAESKVTTSNGSIEITSHSGQ